MGRMLLSKFDAHSTHMVVCDILANVSSVSLSLIDLHYLRIERQYVGFELFIMRVPKCELFYR